MALQIKQKDMEDKVIGFGKGIHREPSLGAVGELSDCVNLYSEGEEMKLMPRIKEDRMLPSRWTAMFIHSNGSVYDHIIMRRNKTYSSTIQSNIEEGDEEGTVTTTSDDGKITTTVVTKFLDGGVKKTVTTTITYNTIYLLCYIDMDSDEQGDDEETYAITELADGETINDITAMGNVLVIATSTKVYYYLWTEGQYIDYSMDKLEDMDIQFTLNGEYKLTPTDSVQVVDIVRDGSTEKEYDNYMAQYTHDGYYQYDGSGYKSCIELLDTSVGFEKGKTYHIKASKGTKYFKYMIAGLKTGDKEDVVVSQVMGLDADVLATTGDLINDSKLCVINTDKLDELAVQKATEDCNITIKENYIAILVFITSTDYRYFRLDVYNRDETSQKYDYAIKKLDDDGGGTTDLDMLQGDINKYIKENGTDKNKFIYPFYIRAAIKLVDGSYVRPTAPILMIPNSGCVPNLYSSKIEMSEGATETAKAFTMAAVCADVKFKINNSDFIEALKQRSEIVSSIAFAVTAPIYTYNSGPTSEERDSAFYLDNDNPNGEGVSVSCISGFTGGYVHSTKELNASKFETMPYYRVTLPTFADYREKMLEANIFYEIKEIKLDDLTNDETLLDLESGVLSGLVGRVRMEDNPSSLKSYNAETLYPYNSRLTLGNMSEKLYIGYNPSLMSGCAYGIEEFVSDSPLGPWTAQVKYKKGEMVSVVTIKKNNQSYKVVNKCTAYDVSKIVWFYYPDEDAKSVDIYVRPYNNDDDETPTDKYFKRHIDLEKHQYLSGAYYLGDIDDYTWNDATPSDNEQNKKEFDKYTESASCEITTTNKVISSVLNNPFVIDSGSASLVGMGVVMKLISNTKALSQGQFGEHPVLAFCTDGIWALTVGSTGVFNAVQPISRDVVNNVESITQLDSAVAFTTDKGLMVLDGSQVKELCKHMDNIDMFDISKFDTLMSDYSGLFVKSDESFIDMLKTCKLVYDEQNTLLWIMPKQEYATDGSDTTEVKQYAVFLENGEVFGYVNPAVISKGRNLKYNAYYGPSSIIPNYPQTYMQMVKEVKGATGKVNTSNVLATFSCEQEGESLKTKGWLLTRPIPFDSAYTMKMLYDMKVEKMFCDDSSAKVVVYVSNNRRDWGRLTSLKSRSFKWYRFAVFCNMDDFDRLTALLCRIDTRRTNKIR